MNKLLILVTLLLTGCSMQTSNTSQEVNNTKKSKVHLYKSNKCYEITNYTTYETQITVYLVDYGKIYLSLHDCMIIKDKCPICEEVVSDVD